MELLDRIKKFASENPDRPAVVDMDGARVTTYGELSAFIGRIAAKLKRAGLNKGDAVIVKMGRRMEYAASELGIIKACLTAVPVLTSYPQERIDYIAEQSGAKLTITESFLMDIEDYEAEDGEGPADDDRSLIIFTSGSTGRPKGIVYTAGVIDFPIRNNNSNSTVVKDIKFAAMAPMSFVATLGEYFNVFSLGGCTHIISDEVRTDISRIEEYYAKHKLSVGFLPPRMLGVYRNSDPELKLINTGSERVSGVFPEGYKVVNNYGQTETCGTVCSFIIDKKYDVTPIGKPKKGVVIHLLDADGNEVRDGEDGEICAEGVFPREYINLPEESAKTFKKLDNGKVLVHTGDIGRKLPDGNYIYVNRRDWMVKINGQRVDPGETEGAMKRIKGVSNAAVKDFTYANGQVYLCGYYVSEEDIDGEAIRTALESRLPPYMIPAYFIKLEAIPVNVNGKLDRSALPEPDISSFREEYAEPEGELEKALCEAFRKILRCEKVGANDNFFLLGGDSIKVMQLQNDLDTEGLTTNIIVKGKTPRRIAALIQSSGADTVGEAIKDEREFYPLTPAQMGIYLACVQNPEGTMYNNPFYMCADKSEIDPERLIFAVKTAVMSHDAVNVRITAADGTPVMRGVKTDFETERVKASDKELEKALKDFVKPFEIINGCLARAAVFETETKFALALDFHHLIYDGTSSAVLLEDISRVYAGGEPEREIMSVLKLGAYEEKLEGSDAYREAKDYFDKVFSGVSDKAELINDFAENTSLENKPAAHFAKKAGEELSAEKTEKLCSLLGITPNTLFLGAFRYALAKFTGQPDVVICAANHGRHDRRMKNTVGMLVRTVPLYVPINEESSVAEYLLSVQNNMRETINNDVYPFVKLSGEYDIAPDIMFAFQSDTFNGLTLGEKRFPLYGIQSESALSKLEVMIFKENDGYSLNFTYRSDLYSDEMIRSFADMYVNITKEFLKKDRLCSVTLTDENQLEAIDKFNETEKPFDRTKSIVDLFRAQARKTPDSTAVVFKEKTFTYGQTDEITDRIAGFLKSRGIGREDVVSILIPRCEYMVLASLGVLKTGAAYQPLDPTYPPERLSFMIKDSGAKLLIADEELLNLIRDFEGQVLLTKDIPSLPVCESSAADINPEDLFILLYTSGSTGVPKGCMLEYGNIAAFCEWYRNFYDLGETSRVAAYASYGFDACMMDMYPALTSGAAVYIIDEKIRLDLDAMNGYFEANGITHGFMTTQVGRMFVSSVDNHSLKYLSTGGETLVPIVPPSSYTFCNLYGPTECTVCITAYKVDKLCDRVPIGHALDNIKLYIVDKYGRRLPVGAAGELCVSGYQVSRGYLDRPEQTAKAYAVNPYCMEDGYTRMYRTGDIARFLPDGAVDFVGRRDGQVKVRGFRIELSEVEEIIRRFNGIKDAAVIAKEAAGGEKYIAAYIVGDEKIGINALNEFIAENKPPYMVPAAVLQIDKIPLNVNGKVDKRRLPEISVREDADEAESARPATLLEEKLCGIVSKIAGHKITSVTADLLKSGMTSLSIIKLAVELKKEFGFECDSKKLMKGCSVISIENELQQSFLDRFAGGTNEKSADVQEKVRRESYPLSASQFGVYAECMRNPRSTMYNIPAFFTFPEGTDPQSLADSVKKVLLAHPYINTHLTMKNGDAEQIYAAEPEVNVPVREMNETELKELKTKYVQPFNLMNSPLYRVTVVKTEKAVYMLTDFHHIIFDGGSMAVFLGQLKTACENGTVDRESYEYYDYADEQNSEEGRKAYKSSEDFFAKMLSECEGASEITSDMSGMPENGGMGEFFVKTDIDAAESFCRENGVTPAHLYYAALSYAVSRFVNSRNVYLSTISNGRSDLSLSDCFGMFVKTIPLGISIDDCTALEFVKKAKEVFTGAVENEAFPYSEICRKYSYSPAIMYEYQIGVLEELRINGKEIKAENLGGGAAKFKTAVHIENREGVPCVVVQYNDALYSRELMRTLALSVENAAKAIINDPYMPVRKISLLDEEQREIIDRFSSTDTSPAENKLMHAGFEKCAEKFPDKTALIACDRTLTYRELDSLANTAANALIARGFKNGSRAVILLSRTSKLIAAVLGVLKAGGTFIPAVPDYPKDRIDSIISDSGAELVITEEEMLDKYDNSVYVDALLSGGGSEKPDVSVSPESLAYMIYTSGSTGKPKGVMLRHEGIANFLENSEANPQISYITKYGHCYGSVTTVSFDLSMKEIWGALCNGLTLAFAGDEQSKDPMLLAEFMKKSGVDIFNATPSRILQYMELDSFAEAIKNCRVILSGGEKYPDKLLKVLREKTNAKLLNTYGPTEITVSSNVKDLTEADRITVGRPLLGRYEYIVDCDGNKLPVGAAGELIIAGCGVGAGYCNLPEQTAKAFIEFEGRRAYRSGDYAKWTADGDVVILGRTDNQIKLRGLRIELDEITKQLTNIKGIKNAAAVIRKLGNADAICAYYTASEPVDESAVKEELKQHLTDYMVPSSFNLLDEMPMTANGKINIKALPEPVQAQRTAGREPLTDTERRFCEIFQNILELPKVYADDNFFELGGSSLTVTRVIIAANKAGINITYGDVFTHPTPKALADFAAGEETAPEYEDLSAYDYSNINRLLAENTLESFKNGEKHPLGNVMLTGATGFLGIHVLHELLHSYDGKIYCMLRSKGRQTAEGRLNEMFYYYFEEVISRDHSDRVFVIEGDVTNKASFEGFRGLGIDTVLHCAANVKHFSKGTDIEDVNYFGTLNVIDFCKKEGSRMVHVSTMSIGGAFIGEQGAVTELKEDQLYYGQIQNSKYTQSKFLAERAVLEAASEGLGAKIMRVGTLSARDTDGEYQINFSTNSFVGRLKANVIVGKYPYEMIEAPFELSPIDYVAKAILLLAQTSDKCCVFHPYNNHTLMMGDLYKKMNDDELYSEPAEVNDYLAALDEVKKNPEKAKELAGLIAYQNMAHGKKVYNVGKSNRYTMQVLYRLGFTWPVTSENYMNRFVRALKELLFFDI